MAAGAWGLRIAFPNRETARPRLRYQGIDVYVVGFVSSHHGSHDGDRDEKVAAISDRPGRYDPGIFEALGE